MYSRIRSSLFTHYGIGIFLTLLWFLIFHEKLFYPLIREEIDYARFLILNTIFEPRTWSPEFFYLTDGHPPLLSFTVSTLVHLVKSTFIIRLLLVLTNLYFFFYFFKWCKSLKIDLWFTFLLGGVLLLGPVHQMLVSSAIGDLLGFSLLLGWAYHRTRAENIKAMFLLLAAVMIRETHALPALLFMCIEFFRERRLRKEMWVEAIPSLALATYFILCKYFTGVWYTFSSKNVITSFTIEQLGNLEQLFPYLRLLIPLVIIIWGWTLRKKNIEKEKIPFYYLGILTVLGSMLLLTPYMITYPKARLTSPFLASAIVALLLTMSKHHHKKLMGLVFILSFIFIEMKFQPERHAEHVQDTQTKFNFLEKLNLPPETVVTGSWPMAQYVSFHLYGYPKLTSEQTNRKFLDDFYNKRITHKYKSGIFFLDLTEEGHETKDYLCSSSCSSLDLEDSRGKIFTIYFKNLDPSYLKQTWELALKDRR